MAKDLELPKLPAAPDTSGLKDGDATGVHPVSLDVYADGSNVTANTVALLKALHGAEKNTPEQWAALADKAMNRVVEG